MYLQKVVSQSHVSPCMPNDPVDSLRPFRSRLIHLARAYKFNLNYHVVKEYDNIAHFFRGRDARK